MKRRANLDMYDDFQFKKNSCLHVLYKNISALQGLMILFILQAEMIQYDVQYSFCVYI